MIRCDQVAILFSTLFRAASCCITCILGLRFWARFEPFCEPTVTFCHVVNVLSYSREASASRSQWSQSISTSPSDTGMEDKPGDMWLEKVDEQREAAYRCPVTLTWSFCSTLLVENLFLADRLANKECGRPVWESRAAHVHPNFCRGWRSWWDHFCWVSWS